RTSGGVSKLWKKPMKSLASPATTRADRRSSVAKKAGVSDSKKQNPVRKTFGCRLQKTVPKRQKVRFWFLILLGQAENPHHFLYLGVGSTATSRLALAPCRRVAVSRVMILVGCWPKRMSAQLAAVYCGEQSVKTFLQRVGRFRISRASSPVFPEPIAVCN